MLDEKDLVLIGKVFDERMLLIMDHHILPHFDDIHREIAFLKGDILDIKREINGINGEMNGIKHDVSWIKGQMVTKGFLEERLENFRIDLGLRYKPAA